MSVLGYIVLFTFIGSVLSLIGGVILLFREQFAIRISHFLAAFAAGALLGTAFFDLLPEAAHEGEELGIDIFFWTLVGFLIFFIVERVLHWFHHHHTFHPEEDSDLKPTVWLVIIGDTLHNLIDGVVIAATFLVSIPTGIVTAFAVAAHELPQEIGDFGIMLHKGLSRGKIILVNLLSAVAAVFGAVGTYLYGERIEGILPIMLSLTAGFFIYIAGSDLIPEIHHKNARRLALAESMILLLGVAVIWVFVAFFGHE